MMKKMVIGLAVMGLLCASASPLLAGGIINKSNLSADYFRSLTRHASTDAADIVAYNPAGVMKMENGIYLKGDVLYINKDYSNDVSTQTTFPYSLVTGMEGDYSSDEPSIVPGLFAVYKEDKWSGFFAVTIPGGGGTVKYDEGNARTAALGTAFILNGLGAAFESQRLDAKSFDIAYTLGGAYQINDMFSVSGGLRYVDAHQEFTGQVDLLTASYSVDLERNATGLGYFLGLNISPSDKLNIGFLYQSNTELDYESDVSEDNSPGNLITTNVGWLDGTKEREDLPGLVGLGVSYAFTPKIRVEVDYTRYLESAAEWEGVRFTGDEGDSWEVGASLTYTFNPQWRASIGYLHTDIVDIEPESLLVEAPELDAHTIGVGVVFSPTPQWQISFGYTDVSYDSVTTDTFTSRAPEGTELEKHVTAFSLGLQYHF